jgi:DNA-binding MarR family transcriptional regulator
MIADNQEESEEAAPAVSKKKNLTEADKKWGKKVIDIGFCIIPSLLLREQHTLKLSAAELVVLLQIADHWWQAANTPFPGKAELAKRLDVTERQVQRIIAKLEKSGLVQRGERRNKYHARMSNFYFLDGLVKKLQELEQVEVEKKEAASKATAEVSARRLASAKRSAANARVA